MKDNTKRNNPIINMLLKIKSSYLSLIAKIKSFFQKQNSNNKNITTEVEDDQQHESLGSESVILSPADEEPEIWYDAKGKSETKNEIDEEEEFFDASGYDKDLENENTVKIEEDEGYVSSSSQNENMAAQNITIKNDQYYNINDFEKTISLNSDGNDTLALAFSGEAIGKITNTKHSLASLYYEKNTKCIHFAYRADNAKDSNVFALNPNSFNIYMPSYLKNNQSKSPKEVFGDNQIVILLQKPKNVNLPPKGIINWSSWKCIEKAIGMKNNPIKINDYFPFDFINFSYSGSNSITQHINRGAESLKEMQNSLGKVKKSLLNQGLSVIDDISNKQEKLGWNIKDILVRGDCISLTKALADVKHLDNANVEPISNNHGSCVSL